MNEYSWLWVVSTWTLYMIFVLLAVCVYFAGTLIWNYFHKERT